jgi:hypothetical protein
MTRPSGLVNGLLDSKYTRLLGARQPESTSLGGKGVRDNPKRRHRI